MIVRITRDLHPARLLPALAVCACVATFGCNGSARLAGRLPYDRAGTEQDPFLAAAARSDRAAGRASLGGDDLAPQAAPSGGRNRFAASWDPLTGMPVGDDAGAKRFAAATPRDAGRVAARSTVRPTTGPAWADEPPAADNPFDGPAVAAADAGPFYDDPGAADESRPAAPPITRINPFADATALPLRTAAASPAAVGTVVPAAASEPAAATGGGIVRAEYTTPAGDAAAFDGAAAFADSDAPAASASIEVMTAEFLAEPDAPPAVRTTAMFVTAGENPFDGAAEPAVIRPARPPVVADTPPAPVPAAPVPAVEPGPAAQPVVEPKPAAKPTPAAEPEFDDFTPPTPVIGPAGDGWQPVRDAG